MLSGILGAPTFALLILMGLLTFSAPALAGENSVTEVLDHIDSEDFIEGIVGDASGVIGAKTIASDTPEVEYLVEHSSDAIPIMLQRFAAPEGIRYEPARIVYFVVFEKP